MEYKHFQTEDFIKDEVFIRWVKYGENESFFQEFILENPHKKSCIEEACGIVKLLVKAESGESINIDQSSVWSHISDKLEEPQTIPKTVFLSKVKHFKWTKTFWAAAALLIIGLVSKGVLDNTQRETISYTELLEVAEKQTKLIEKVNNSSEPLLVELTDGSTILLSPSAKVSYPTKFDESKRQVFLSGEAFFDVIRNPRKPFFVYANEVVTKVLGTSFTIKAEDDDNNVVVSVKTGRVSVFQQNKIDLIDPEEKGLIITPNQQIVFSRKEESLKKSLVNSPILVQDLSFFKERSFEDKPVTEVLKVVEEAYGVHIIYDADQLSNCIITTTLADESLYSKLDVLCKTIGASYKVIDAQIVIQSGGCD
ncbi:protein of unknown function [Spirosomataceae bacterium TFI 002]|nr:protein of unknown function [Spirosomataceae bacterium TFI 002]